MIVGVSFLALIVQLYMIDVGLTVPISPVFNSTGYISRLLSESAPLCLSIMILVWLKRSRIGSTNDQKLAKPVVFLLSLCSLLGTAVLLRAEDTYAMVSFPYGLGPTIPSWVWTRVVFYFSLSMMLFMIPVLFFGIKGLIILLPTAIIPAFYTFNNDMVVNATKVASLTFLYPIYLAIVEFGRLETWAIEGSLLNLFGTKALSEH